MLDFSQFSGLVLFMFIFTAGFWLLIFLLTFVVPYWIGGTIWENMKLKKEAKKAAQGKQFFFRHNINLVQFIERGFFIILKTKDTVKVRERFKNK